MMEIYKGQLKTASYNIREYTYKGRVKAGEKKKRKACEDIFCFDIETSSFWLDKEGNIVTYEKGQPSEYWNSLTPMSIPYIWQFSMNDTVYYGREFWDFYALLDDLPKHCEIKIFVHNLSWEMHFLDNLAAWDKVFCRVPHKPMTAVFKQFKNIEFRCTYMLTRLSLDSWGKSLGVHKKTGDLDYLKLRTPLTKMTKKELSYCEYDLRVMTAGIRQYLKTYEYINQIPLTQTGTVRREVRKRVQADKEYMRLMHKLVPRNVAEYDRYMNIFSGGYTHANYHYAGDRIDADIYGPIKHLDFASSYPTVMIAEKYPCSQFFYYGNKLPPEETFDYKAYIMLVQLDDIECTTFNTYIQASKCYGSHFQYDNGRVRSASFIQIWITEMDWLIIKNTYKWEKMTVLETWAAHKDYLPKVFTEYILELYHDKTALKGIKGQEEFYMKQKERLNALYGMCATQVLQADVTYDQIEQTWGFKMLTHDQIQERFDDLRRWYDKRYFVHYAWGCWVTMAARFNLWQLIQYCDQDLLYCDTDSIFYIGDHNFTWYNNQVTEKLKRACSETGLDFEKTQPKDKNGIVRPMGVLTEEEECIQFKTLGAKKYVERWKEDNKLHLTISGINKEAVEVLEDDIDNFADGLNFDKDHPAVHKQILTYITDQPLITMPDGYKITTMRGINLRANGYKIHLTDAYKDLIESDNYDIDGIPDAVFNNLRGAIKPEEVYNGNR